MKKKYSIGFTFTIAAALVSFGFLQLDLQREEEQEIAIAKAEAITAQFINQIYRAHFTGDLSELKQFVAEKDTEGIIRGVLKEKGIDLKAPRMWITGGSVGLFPFDNSQGGNFEDGSVLLSRTVGSTTSDLLASIIPCIYTHSGLLDQELYTGNDAGCIVTADLSGVTYESWNDWNNFDGTGKIVTKLNVEKVHGVWPKPWQLYRAQRWIRWYLGWTIYSFLKLNLDPVSRWDPIRWYCSKTVWRVLNRRGLDLDVENTDWYGSSLQEALYNVRDSILYVLVERFLGRDKAEEKLLAALDECITPDEIRFATTTFGYPLDIGSKKSWMSPSCPITDPNF